MNGVIRRDAQQGTVTNYDDWLEKLNVAIIRSSKVFPDKPGGTLNLDRADQEENEIQPIKVACVRPVEFARGRGRMDGQTRIGYRPETIERGRPVRGEKGGRIRNLLLLQRGKSSAGSESVPS